MEELNFEIKIHSPRSDREKIYKFNLTKNKLKITGPFQKSATCIYTKKDGYHWKSERDTFYGLLIDEQMKISVAVDDSIISDMYSWREGVITDDEIIYQLKTIIS